MYKIEHKKSLHFANFFYVFILTKMYNHIIITNVVRQIPSHADMAELVDAQDLKSCGG